MEVFSMTSPTVAGKRRAAPRTRKRRDDRIAAAVLLAPSFAGFLVFYVYPALRGLWYSFTDFSMLKPPNFVGVDNYATALGSAEVWNAFVVTVVYAAYNIIGQTFLGLLLAALMQRFARSTWVRSMLLLPWLVPNVAIALIWGWLLDANLGFVTHLLMGIGIEGVTFFNEHAAMPIVAGINIWAYTGYTALLLYAGMLQIPGELYESAALDGAGENIIMASSGWGDGVYPVMLTRDADGAPLGLHIDLGVVGGFASEDEEDDEDE